MTVRRLLGIIIVVLVLVALVTAIILAIRMRSSKVASVAKPSPAASSKPTDSFGQMNDVILLETGPANKSYINNGVTFYIPSSWGVLTCSNSENFEFDPANSSNVRTMCDVAQKPITVMSNSVVGCGGEVVTLGGTRVQKSRVENSRGVDYRWCFSANGRQYNITHRVSQSGSRATSQNDYSAAIEQMIASIDPLTK